MLKRLFDITLSLIGIILLLPLLALIAFAIKLTSRGPVFYYGERVGRSGKTFKIIKFRTMVPDAERLGSSVTAQGDPRLTKTGRFLKRHKLDELPQLFNILKGEMSFVGPRPEIKMFIDLIPKEERDIILTVRPGLTDLATLYSQEEGILRESPDPEKSYVEVVLPKKTKLQIDYVRNRSFFLDLKILLKTFIRLIVIIFTSGEKL
ncbi:MAG: sugar transferase [candidate division WOR-3 bacterium]